MLNICTPEEPYRSLYNGGQPTAADRTVQEQLRGHVMRTTGIEAGSVLGDLKLLAAHSFLHLLLAICGDQVKCVCSNVISLMHSHVCALS